MPRRAMAGTTRPAFGPAAPITSTDPFVAITPLETRSPSQADNSQIRPDTKVDIRFTSCKDELGDNDQVRKPHQEAPSTDPFDEHLLYEAKKISMSLGRMFAPFCEVVLHDLRKPEASIIAIENPISGRKIGDSATNLGLARITQPNFPDVVQNYSNVTVDGRRLKSTSIGVRGKSGAFIASICLNLDTTRFTDLLTMVQSFAVLTESAPPVVEELRTLSLSEIRSVVADYSRERNLEPAELRPSERREIVSVLYKKGLLDLKNAKAFTAELLGVTRPSIYNYLNHGKASA